MSIKLEISNFQSIEQATLDIKEGGFTCIVGPSNIGKSAIRRALEALLYNKSESSYIRNGCKACEVILNFNDGTNIKWTRDDKTAWYEINGEVFSKLNKSVPDIILEKGFKELVINKEKFSVQVAPQFDNIFLLNKNGSFITEVISNLGNLNKIISSNKACNSDINKNKERQNIRKDDLIRVQAQIESFSGLDSQEFLVKQLKDHIQVVKNAQDVYSKASKLSLDYELSIKRKEAIGPVLDITLTTDTVDTSTFMSVSKAYKELVTRKDKLLGFKGLESIEVSDSSVDLDAYNKAKSLYKNYVALENNISKTTELSNITIIESDIEINTYNKLKVLFNQVTLSKEAIIGYRTKIQQNEKSEISYIEEQSKLHKEIGACPLCNKSFNGE